MAGDQFEQRVQRAVARFHVLAGIAIATRSVQNGEIELFVVGIERNEQVEHFVQNFHRAAIRTVDLVDDDDGLQPQRQRLAGDELGLRHGPFGAVHQQDHAVDHAEDTFDLGPEIGVSRRVDDIDADVVPFDAGAFGKDGDPAFFLQIVGIHRAFFHPLVFAERAGLAEQLIDQGGLAVIDVCDDRNIAQLCGHGENRLSVERVQMDRRLVLAKRRILCSAAISRAA